MLHPFYRQKEYFLFFIYILPIALAYVQYEYKGGINMKKLLLTVIQIALLFIFARLINWVTALLHINIPGSIIGIVILFTLLHFNIIKLEWIELGAAWLLGELLLFFIPSAVGVIEYGDIMSKFGVSILLVVIISTFVVMVSTGTLTQLIAKRKEKKHTCSSEL
ncbi:Holin-like protein CidA [Bacillus subtilis]|nr:holin-like protein [Bacillus subtilis J22]CAF1719792.1 Holin-like protein CidA [Bacillus subtilis]SIP99593.1 holin-like protein [Bacillus subtilis]